MKLHLLSNMGGGKHLYFELWKSVSETGGPRGAEENRERGGGLTVQPN